MNAMDVLKVGIPMVDIGRVRDLVPVLIRAGAQDLIEYALNKVLP